MNDIDKTGARIDTDEKGFQRKANDLLMFVGDWRTNMLFKATMQEMIHEVGLLQTMGADPLVVSERVGALAGILKAQESWLTRNAERLVASGQAEWAGDDASS